MLTKIPLAEATTDQLREFAQTTLGISIHPSSKPETALTKINEAWDKDFILVSTPDLLADEAEQFDGFAPQVGGPLPVTAGQQPPKDGYVRVLIPQSEAPGGRDAVQLSVNGVAMLVARDKPSDIRYRYLEVLKNAVQAIYDPLPEGGISTTPRMVPTINFQILAYGKAVPDDDNERRAA